LKDVLGNVLELTRSRLYEFGAEVNPADEDNVAAARGDFAVSAESAIMFLATYYRSNHGLAPFGEATAYHGFRCVRSLSLGR
jgi:formylglycine-generating enzyme required for sulfatase activity